MYRCISARFNAWHLNCCGCEKIPRYNQCSLLIPHVAVTIPPVLQLNVHLIDERNRADKRKVQTFAGFGGKLESKRVGKAKVRSFFF